MHSHFCEILLTGIMVHGIDKHNIHREP